MGDDTEMDEPQSFWDENWVCGTAFEPSAAMVRAIAENGEFQGYAGAAGLPPFLIGRLPGPFSGLVLFVKRNNAWQGYAIEDGGAAQGVYCAPEAGSAIVFSMKSRGGPGCEYSVLSTTNGFASADCATIPFPGELNTDDRGEWDYRGEFLNFVAFNADAQGKGALIANAEVGRGDQSRTYWYQYETRDSGKTWDEAQKLNNKPALPSGIYQDISGGTFDHLIKDILSSISSSSKA